MVFLLKDLPKETLLKVVDAYAKAWQAMDGAYFLALEKKYGMDVAIEMDKEAWRIFSPIEAKRIMRGFEIPENGGLQSLEKALGFDSGIYCLRKFLVFNNTYLFAWEIRKTLAISGNLDSTCLHCKNQGFVIFPLSRLCVKSCINPKTKCFF